MNWMSKLKGMVVGDEMDEEYEGQEYYAEEQEEEPSHKLKNRVSRSNIRDTAHISGDFNIIVSKPEKFEDVAEIVNLLKDNDSVVVNLENTNKEVAGRIVDFLAGAAYFGEGNIKKIANFTYIVTPNRVSVDGMAGNHLDAAVTF